MLGLMQQRPLLISSLLDYAERYHAGTEIVSRSVEGPFHRSNWGTIAARAKRVANALRRLGVQQSERIATLAWNHNRHLEIYFGVTCSGAVLYTVNPRLFPDQVRFIIGDAEASFVFFDVTFAALVEEHAAAAGTGAKLVLPGMKLDGASLFELIRDEGITFCGAVPTVWLNLFDWMEQNLNTTDQRALKLKRVLSGGSAVPRVVIEKAFAYFGATMLHAWGMTEMSPLGTCGSLLARHVRLDLEQQMPVHLTQGRTIYGAEVRIVDDEGRELPRDGRSIGEIQVRGP